jgi:hypothetical protein
MAVRLSFVLRQSEEFCEHDSFDRFLFPTPVHDAPLRLEPFPGPRPECGFVHFFTQATQGV